MGISLKFHHPHFPDGYKFALNDLGVIENNGDALEISDEQAAQFTAAQGKTVEEAFADSPEVTVEGGTSKKNDSNEQQGEQQQNEPPTGNTKETDSEEDES